MEKAGKSRNIGCHLIATRGKPAMRMSFDFKRFDFKMEHYDLAESGKETNKRYLHYSVSFSQPFRKEYPRFGMMKFSREAAVKACLALCPLQRLDPDHYEADRVSLSFHSKSEAYYIGGDFHSGYIRKDGIRGLQYHFLGPDELDFFPNNPRVAKNSRPEFIVDT